MSEYTVTVYEKITHIVQVEAESEDDALEKAYHELQESDVDYAYDAVFTGTHYVEEGW
jgi:hypothetical protein